MTFQEFVAAATNGEVSPYRYQVGLAESGLPDVLRAPTGAGKTLAAVLPWLYRRVQHADSGVRATTPKWLVVVLPQRTLVEQTVRKVRAWVDALGLPVGVHLLMGGEDDENREWKMHPERERIFVGTQDMVLSRLLMRGFAESRGAWPMSFGLLHAGVQFVFDEVQLMGPGLPTSLQLQGLREVFGAAIGCRSMWMSATLDTADLSTVDFSRKLDVVDVVDSDGDLTRRMTATRTVQHLVLEADQRTYSRVLADRIVAEHRPATRTLVVMNTVERAVDTHAALLKLAPSARIVLLHSRFRPDDRMAHTDTALADPVGEGLIVVATQVLEAGVDLTSETLITEVAPWPSIVQRAGRCNRDGNAVRARLLWTAPPGPKTHLPYETSDLNSTSEALAALEGRAVTGPELAELDVVVHRPLHPILRRRDLLDLFDTTPDLSGNDIDVSPFIRDADDRTVSVAWRDLAQDMPAVDRRELCQAPIAEVRKMATPRGRAWIWDQADTKWRPAVDRDVRPGAIIVLDAGKGGYLANCGFAPSSTQRVEPVAISARPSSGFDSDHRSEGYAVWLSLADHLIDTEHAAAELVSTLESSLDLSPDHCAAIVQAAKFHDLGKAYSSFSAALVATNPESPPPDCETVWGKSPSKRRLIYDPPHFRHELVSALWLLEEPSLLEDIDERDLAVYLVAAHHGKVRVTIRGRADEPPGTVLGVRNGCKTTGFVLDGQSIPPVAVSLRHTTHGSGSLTDRALHLRDRSDVGPFRLAFCEAMVRIADWRSSAGEAGDR